MPGAANSRIRPRCAATGPEPGPSSQSRSSIRRPNRAEALTTSNALPQSRTTGASGRSRHRASVLRGYAPAEASQAAPSAVTPETSSPSDDLAPGLCGLLLGGFRVLLMPHTSTGGERPVPEGCPKPGQAGVRWSILPGWHMPGRGDRPPPTGSPDRPGSDRPGFDCPDPDRPGPDCPGFDRPGFDRAGPGRPGRPGCPRQSGSVTP